MKKNWVDAWGLREAQYTQLPPGDYSFMVRACDHQGVWSRSPASVHLRKLPFIWQTDAVGEQAEASAADLALGRSSPQGLGAGIVHGQAVFAKKRLPILRTDIETFFVIVSTDTPMEA